MHGVGLGFSQVFDKVSCVTCGARCSAVGQQEYGGGGGGELVTG